MKSSIKKLKFGFEIQSNGVVKPAHFQERDFTRAYLPVPVKWEGAPAQLVFWNYTSRKTPINSTASRLITHPGFDIRGRAVVITGSESLHCLKFDGPEWEAKMRSAHLAEGFKDMVLYRPGGRHQTYTNIFSRDQDDAFQIKMALWGAR